MKKILSKRILIMGISFITLAALFSSCEPDTPRNPDDNAAYWRQKTLNE